MDRLIAMPRNPIPTGAVVGRIEGHDGVGLRVARWPAALRERQGTVCLFGGRTEFIEKYLETIADLRRRGFAVATMDWRGQGGSDRLLKDTRKGHVEDFADYEADLEVFMREVVLPDCPPPYYALAHSMGGAVLLRAARSKDCWFDRMVLTAPMLGLAELPVPESVLAAIAEAAVFLGLGDLYVPGTRADPQSEADAQSSLLTSDPRRLERNRAILALAPELAVGGPTIGWLRAALATMRLLAGDDFPAAVQVPVLMLAAGNDRIVRNDAIERLAVQLKVGEHIVIAGARHELLQERDIIREQVWAAFDAFTPGSSPKLSRQVGPRFAPAGGDLRRQ